uniref:Uncharacterized protein n=1 Tax=Moniliophthora roreri TaxID=221103 RepID=A0A0W0EVA4_MONRR
MPEGTQKFSVATEVQAVMPGLIFAHLIWHTCRSFCIHASGDVVINGHTFNASIITALLPSNTKSTHTPIGVSSQVVTQSSTSPSNNLTARSAPSPGIIAGAILGGIIISLFFIVIFRIYHRKRKQRQRQLPPSESTISPYPDTYVYNDSATTFMKRNPKRREDAADEQQSSVPQAHDVLAAPNGPSTQLESASQEEL